MPDPERPATVNILHGEPCNLAWIMCRQDRCDRQIISISPLMGQVDWPPVDNVELPDGEVLAMAQAKEFFVWLTQERRKKADPFTNGVLIIDL